jgi:hypothetical protein
MAVFQKGYGKYIVMCSHLTPVAPKYRITQKRWQTLNLGLTQHLTVFITIVVVIHDIKDSIVVLYTADGHFDPLPYNRNG